MIEKITMITCDICGEVDYFLTNSVNKAKQCAIKSKNPWIFKQGKHFCCQSCYETYLEENK